MHEQRLPQFRGAVAVVLILLLTACASAPQSAQLLSQNARSPFAEPVNLLQVPFFPQEDYQCGPAALATTLQYSDVNVSPQELVDHVYVPARQGSLQVEMLAAARTFGRLSYQLPASLEALLMEVREGRPVLVMQNLGVNWYPQWHYAVVVGYDLSERELVLRSGTEREYRMPLSVFERTWQRSEYWSFVVLRPGEMPVQAQEASYFESVAAFERVNTTQHAAQAYLSGLQAWPRSRVLGMGLGNLHYASGQLEEAAGIYRNVLSHSPDYAAAHNNLAQVLLSQQQFPQALIHARQAVELGGRYVDAFKATLQEILHAIDSLPK